MPFGLDDRTAVTPLYSTSVGQETIAFTAELLVVSLILGAFSGLYFTVSALSDAAGRVGSRAGADLSLRRPAAESATPSRRRS